MTLREPIAIHRNEAPDPTASSLLVELRRKSPVAWTRFVAIYTPLVYRWARRAGVSADDAADIVQDVFQGVVGQITNFRRERPGDSFRGWLYGITRNKIADHFRRQAGRAEAVGGSEMQQRLAGIAADDSDSGDGSEQADDRALVLRQALEQIRGEFTGTTWDAFCRLAIEGQAAAEIGRDLGLTAKAVRQAKYRVLKRLREELSELE